MNKRLLQVLALTLVVSGCANTEEISGFDPEFDALNMNGKSFAGAKANEANVYGTEGRGLSSNPERRPGGKVLGAYDSDLGETTVSSEPDMVSVYPNDMVVVNARILQKGDKDHVDGDGNPAPIEAGPVRTSVRVVARLEKGDPEANASLIWSSDDSDGARLIESYEDMLVIETSSTGKLRFKVQTGTLYNNKKPMYYVNIWQANAGDPGTTEINVKALPLKEDYKEGNPDEKNNLNDEPKGFDKATGKADALMELTSSQQQNLFVEARKTLGVKVTTAVRNAEGSLVEGRKEAEGDDVCYTIVPKNTGDDAAVINSNSESDCKKTDQFGIVNFDYRASKLYNQKSYLNFFHKSAPPVSYEIMTFAMPNTLGEPGEDIGADFDGDGKPDQTLIDAASGLSDDKTITGPNGKPSLTPEDSLDVLKKLAETEPVIEEMMNSTEFKENCYDGEPSDENFICYLSKNDKGNWDLIVPGKCYDSSGNEIPGVTSKVEPKTSELICVNKDGSVYEGGAGGYVDDKGNTVVLDKDGNPKTDAEGNAIVVAKGGELIPATGPFKDADGDEVFFVEGSGFFKRDGEGKLTIRGTEPVTDASGREVSIKDGKPVVTANKGEEISGTGSPKPGGATPGASEHFKHDMDGDGVDDPFTIATGKTPVDTDGDTVPDKEVETFEGFDTTGDGKSDVPPDPCTVNSNQGGCPGGGTTVTNKIRCSDVMVSSKLSEEPGDATFSDRCKLWISIDESKSMFVKYVDKDGKKISNETISFEIIGANDDKNNARLTGGQKNYKSSTSDSGIASTDFESGTAHSIYYTVKVTAPEARPIHIPVYVKQDVPLPTGQGDAPSEDDIKNGFNPPKDMPITDKAIGDANVKLIPTIYNESSGKWEPLRSTTITSPIVRTPLLRVMVQDAKNSSVVYPDAEVYWQVVRGPSEANNAVLKKSRTTADLYGVTSNEFYTGTGYDSRYYIIPHNPNELVDETDRRYYLDPDTKKRAGRKPYFMIITEPIGSVVQGYGSETKRVECTEKNPEDCTKITCKVGDEEITTTNMDDCKKGTSGNNSNVVVDTVDGKKTNKSLPQLACNDAVRRCVNALDDKNATDYSSCATSQEGLRSESGPQGCLLFEIEGDENRTEYLGRSVPIRARLRWFDTMEVNAVNDKIYWTLDKSDEADGSLSVLKTSIDPNTGYATQRFRTGSKITKYRLNAMHPNISHVVRIDGADRLTMEPVSVSVSTISEAMDDRVTVEKTVLNASVNVTNEFLKRNSAQWDGVKVKYSVISGEGTTCDSNFPVMKEAERKESCEKAPSWGLGDAAGRCDVDGNKSAGTDIELSMSSMESLIVYATALDANDNVIGYGCTEGVTFPRYAELPASCAKITDDMQLSEIPAECKVFAKVALQPIGITLPSKMNVKALYDFGGVMTGDTSLGKTLEKATNTYVEFLTKLGADSNKSYGEMVADALEKYILVNEYSSDCPNNFPTKWCDSNKYPTVSACASGAENDTEKKQKYKECECICGKFYYYTSLMIPYPDKVKPLVKKAIASGVDSLLGKTSAGGETSIEAQLCSIFDGLQFIEMTGDLNLIPNDDNKSRFDRKGNKFVYNGIIAKAFGKTYTPEIGYSVIEGGWSNGFLENGVDSFVAENVSFNLAYGTLVYQILGDIFGMDKDGTLRLNKLISCDRFFPDGISIFGMTIASHDVIANLCDIGLGVAEKSIIDFSESKYTVLGVTQTATGKFRRSTDGSCTAGACDADRLEEGVFDGRISLSGSNSDMDALWVGSTSSDLPEYVYTADKSIKDFKAERSVCRRQLRAKIQERDAVATNEFCLMGTFEEGDRSINNACGNAKCKNNPSIVVCTNDGKFNSEYAKSTKAEIIYAANKACKGATGATKDACEKNPEIISTGEDFELTNANCYKDKCGSRECKDRKAIPVCVDGDIIDLTELKTSAGCKDVSSKYSLDAECSMKIGQMACANDQDDVSCIMSADSKRTVEKVFVKWTKFDGDDVNYFEGGKANNDAFAKKLNSGLAPDTDSIQKSESSISWTGSDTNKVKFVTGTDGSMGAIGISSVGTDNVTINAAVPSSCSEITKVSFKVVGDGRVIKVNGSAGSTTPSGSAWKTFVVKYTEKAEKTVKLTISLKSSDKTGYKLFRLDDVEVYGKCDVDAAPASASNVTDHGDGVL